MACKKWEELKYNLIDHKYNWSIFYPVVDKNDNRVILKQHIKYCPFCGNKLNKNGCTGSDVDGN